MTAGYSGTPLSKKLGRSGISLTLLHAPDGFIALLDPLPEGVRIRMRAGASADIAVLFVTRFSVLRSEFDKAAEMLPEAGGMLWVAWPKRAAKTDTDLDENIVRDHGLGTGLVDTKVCAIDEKWSGLRFSRRRLK